MKCEKENKKNADADSRGRTIAKPNTIPHDACQSPKPHTKHTYVAPETSSISNRANTLTFKCRCSPPPPPPHTEHTFCIICGAHWWLTSSGTKIILVSCEREVVSTTKTRGGYHACTSNAHIPNKFRANTISKTDKKEKTTTNKPCVRNFVHIIHADAGWYKIASCIRDYTRKK